MTNEIQVFQSDSFRAGWRTAIALLGPLIEAQSRALARKDVKQYVLPGAPGTGWTNAADADAFIAWFNKVSLKLYDAGSRDGARAATSTSLALLSLKGCRTAGDLLRTALPAWVLP